MAEPTATASSIIAVISATLLAVLGVDYYSVLWSFLGVLAGLFFRDTPMGRNRALVYVGLSTLIGAALGNFGVQALDAPTRVTINGACLVGGAGAMQIVAALLAVVSARLKRAEGGGNGN